MKMVQFLVDQSLMIVFYLIGSVFMLTLFMGHVKGMVICVFLFICVATIHHLTTRETKWRRETKEQKVPLPLIGRSQ